jgi:hypothetical protein
VKVVNFLERQSVIRFFGYALLVVPFLNIFFHLVYLKNSQNLSWHQINISQYLKSGTFANYFLSVCSCLIGMTMLSGSKQAWKFVLILLAAHMGIQVMNYKSHIWQGPLAWVTFTFNLSVFLFISDQLVWKSKSTSNQKSYLKSENRNKSNRLHEDIIHLKSYKKILFSFGSLKPWGRLITLDQNQLIVSQIDQLPASVQGKIIEITFSPILKLDIQYDYQESDRIYFRPLNMTGDKIKNLNQWLRDIAV